MARWRINEFSNDYYIPYLIGIISTREYREELYDTAVKWLRNASISSSGWGSVWLTFQPNTQEKNSSLSAMAIDHLHAQARFSNNIEISYQWCLIWTKLWRSGLNQESLLDSARMVMDRSNRLSDPFVRMILLFLVETEPSRGWAMRYMRDWLRTPRSYGVWVESYIKYSKLFDEQDIRNSGVRWLNRLGAGMNSWRHLWIHCKDFMSTAERVDISINWLSRSRKDLSSWPAVFFETLSLLEGKPTRHLIFVAKSWTAFHAGRRRSRAIEHVAQTALPSD